MNNTGWVMHKIKFSELNQHRLAEQTPPGHTHFMAPSYKCNDSISCTELYIKILNKQLK